MACLPCYVCYPYSQTTGIKRRRIFKIGLQAEDVAAAIAKAVQGRRISYTVGMGSGIWAPLDKFLPEILRARLTARLIGNR